MAKIDRVKELIDFLKAIFIFVLLINTSLIAWEFKNYSILDEWKLYLVLLLIVILSFVTGKLFLVILEKIKSLEDIE